MLVTSAERAGSVDAAPRYEDLRQEFIGIVRAASEDELEAPVAASPAWRVRDVLAHVTGITYDLNRQNLAGDSSGLCQTPAMIRALLVALVVLLVATFPATWLLMLFFGNLGVNLSYWGTLPLGILVSALLGGAGAGSYRV